jgi:hypothetical protein
MSEPGSRNVLGDPQVRVALLTAAALVVQAVVAKNVLDVELDLVSQYGALWVFLVFLLSGKRDRVSELGTDAVIVLVNVAVLALYAV